MNSSRRIRRAIVVVGVVAMAMSLFVAPASAAPGTGAVVFTCTANYPTYPGNSGGTCMGTATGAVVTTAGPQSFVQAPFFMNFGYIAAGGVTCPFGLAVNGNFNIGGAVVGNFTSPAGIALATGASAFTVFNVNGAGITAGNGEGYWAQESPQAVSNCLAGGGPMTATVAGEMTFHDTN